jgi:hypothetical protein
VVAGSDDAKAYDAFDRWHKLATSDGIWDRQGDSEEIAIGTRRSITIPSRASG